MIRRELWEVLRVGDLTFVGIYSVVPFLKYKRISEEKWKPAALLLYSFRPFYFILYYHFMNIYF
jgi:hypothetical protein